jgi:hypothetical protein
MRGRRDYEKATPQAGQAQGLAVTEICEPGLDQAVAAGSGLPMSVPRPASCVGPGAVIDPDALVAVQQPDIVQDLQVVADRGLDRSNASSACAWDSG